MSYKISRKTTGDFDAVTIRVKDALKAEGFGVLSEIDVDLRDFADRKHGAYDVRHAFSGEISG